MTADCPTDYPYEPALKYRDADALRRYWSVAKGLQAVDGLETSNYLDALSQDTIDGKITLEQSGHAIRDYYANAKMSLRPLKAEVAGSNKASSHEPQPDLNITQEADLVAQRIAEMLARGAFLFAPEMLNRIHSYLFQDLEEDAYHPGQFKTEPLMKRESILNGDSVSYSDPSLIEPSLRIAFEDELDYEYGLTFDEEALTHLSKFISRIWQVHPFVEGNTRTIAVFVILYLNDLGYDISNEPFEKNARYFRDSLVRACYRNPKAAVLPELRFLVEFLDAILNDKGESSLKFDSDNLKAQSLFDDPSLLRNMPPL